MKGQVTISENQLRYLWAWITCALCMCAFYWVATVGQPIKWVTQGNNQYHILARQFLAGTTAMPDPIPAGLEKLANPYDPASREQALINLGASWDRTVNFRTGKMYLYYGPLPAGLFALFRQVTGLDLPGVIWNLLCCLGILAAQTCLLLAVGKNFPQIPAWCYAVAVLICASSSGLLPEIRDGEVYQNAAYGGILFASWSLVFAYLGAEKGRAGLVGLAGLCIVLALSCRVPSVFWSLPTLFAAGSLVYHQGWKIFRPLILASLPALGVLVSLGYYNHVRWGSPLETGLSNQLTVYDHNQPILEWNQPYEAAKFNAHAFFFNPPSWAGNLELWNWAEASPVPQPSSVVWHERSAGILACYPALLLGVWVIGAILGAHPPPLKWWVTGAVLSVFLLTSMLLLLKIVTYRYTMDLSFGLGSLAAIAYLSISQRSVINRLRATIFSIFGILWGLSVGASLAQRGYHNLRVPEFLAVTSWVQTPAGIISLLVTLGILASAAVIGRGIQRSHNAGSRSTLGIIAMVGPLGLILALGDGIHFVLGTLLYTLILLLSSTIKVNPQ